MVPNFLLIRQIDYFVTYGAGNDQPNQEGISGQKRELGKFQIQKVFAFTFIY